MPNKVTTEVRAAANALIDDPIYRERLADDLRKREVAPAIEVLLWHYAKGKPTDIIEMQGALRVSTMTDEELRARALELIAKSPDGLPLNMRSELARIVTPTPRRGQWDCTPCRRWRPVI